MDELNRTPGERAAAQLLAAARSLKGRAVSAIGPQEMRAIRRSANAALAAAVELRRVVDEVHARWLSEQAEQSGSKRRRRHEGSP